MADMIKTVSRARSLKGLSVVALPLRNLGGTNKQVKEFLETYLDCRSGAKLGLPSSPVTSSQA